MEEQVCEDQDIRQQLGLEIPSSGTSEQVTGPDK